MIGPVRNMIRGGVWGMVGLFALVAAQRAVWGADDWRQFRGDGNGAVKAADLPTEWSASQNVVWKQELPGFGTSSPIVVGKFIYVTCYSGYGLNQESPGDQQRLVRHLICLKRADGSIAWRRDVPTTGEEHPYSGFQALHGYASSTPVSDGKNVYCFFGRSGVVAYALQGRKLWQQNVGTRTHDWGSASSPVVHKDLVIVNAGVESGALVALDRRNGKEKWRRAGVTECWGSPLLVDVGGKKELVLSIKDKIGGFDPDTGKPLWQCDGVGDYVCPSVISYNGVIYAIGGRSGQCLAVKAGGKGDVTQSHRLWTANVGSNVTSPVYHEGHLYWVSDAGLAVCVDATNGNMVYRERSGVANVYASATLADGKLFVVSREDGAVVLAASPKFERLAQNDLQDRSVFNASPVVHDGQLLLRSDRAVYCIGKGKE